MASLRHNELVDSSRSMELRTCSHKKTYVMELHGLHLPWEYRFYHSSRVMLGGHWKIINNYQVLILFSVLVWMLVWLRTCLIGLFHQYGLTLILEWISNRMPNNVWDEITYPFSNFNDCTFQVWKRKTHTFLDIFKPGSKLIHVGKRATLVYISVDISSAQFHIYM